MLILARDADTTDATILVIVVVATLGIAVFLTVVGWAKNRRLEREAFYRTQLHQRMLERDQLTPEYLEREDARRLRVAWEKRRDALRLGGLLLLAMAAALFFILAIDDRDAPPVGVIPGALGAALLLFARLSPPPSGGDHRSGT